MQTLTKTQKQQIAQNIVKQYACIRGAHAQTMLQGIACFYANSGVESDAHAANNATLHTQVIDELAAITNNVEAAAVYAAELEAIQ
tara:strand:+ start:478 stop:735 length:258 start_codon:yes stop_codon:yes gene_type:complete